MRGDIGEKVKYHKKVPGGVPVQRYAALLKYNMIEDKLSVKIRDRRVFRAYNSKKGQKIKK